MKISPVSLKGMATALLVSLSLSCGVCTALTQANPPRREFRDGPVIRHRPCEHETRRGRLAAAGVHVVVPIVSALAEPTGIHGAGDTSDGR
jgi:hypothetical protein